jgi:hypothetical protein
LGVKAATAFFFRERGSTTSSGCSPRYQKISRSSDYLYFNKFEHPNSLFVGKVPCIVMPSETRRLPRDFELWGEKPILTEADPRKQIRIDTQHGLI